MAKSWVSCFFDSRCRLRLRIFFQNALFRVSMEEGKTKKETAIKKKQLILGKEKKRQ